VRVICEHKDKHRNTYESHSAHEKDLVLLSHKKISAPGSSF